MSEHISLQDSLHEKLRSYFHENKTAGNSVFAGSKNTTLQQVRAEAFSQFETLDFPTIRNEEWKYFNVFPLLSANYSFTTNQAHSSANELPTLELQDIPLSDLHLDADSIVFLNGVFSPELSTVTSNDKLVITPLSNILDSQDVTDLQDTLIQELTTFPDTQINAFSALNSALWSDGVFIRVGKNFTAERPLQLVFVTDARHENRMSFYRNIIISEKNSDITFVEQYHTIGEHVSFVNTILQVQAHENARVNWTKLQHDSPKAIHITNTHITQKRDSVIETTTVSLDAAAIRNNMTFVLGGENAVAHLYGLAALKDSQKVDNHTLVDHAVPHCESNQLYKHVLDERSTGIFNGKIMVREDAQKTNAYQSNRTLLLSEGATINSKPQLEIFADDVKCSHGATSGQLDTEQLFYLRARGIPEQRARAILTHAFASDALQHITIPQVVEFVEHVLSQRLHDEE